MLFPPFCRESGGGGAEDSLLRNPEMPHLFSFMNKPDFDKGLLVVPSVNKRNKGPCKEEVNEVT